MNNNEKKTGNVLAIDPGNIESGIVLIAPDYKPIMAKKAPNEDLLEEMTLCIRDFDEVAIEMVASYGMPVGASVFETCVWIGRFEQRLRDFGKEVERIPRLRVKINLCHKSTAKDSNITQALVDRFAPNEPNKGKGTKKAPGFFYGFKKDIWQAYALGVTYLDEKNF